MSLFPAYDYNSSLKAPIDLLLNLAINCSASSCTKWLILCSNNLTFTSVPFGKGTGSFSSCGVTLCSL